MKKTLKKILGQAIKTPLKFGFYWILTFSILVAFASFLGILEESNDDTPLINMDTEDITPEKPSRVIIDRIGIDSKINNPESRNITILDESLKSGVVRYPESGLIGSKNNVLLFGHSSDLPVVLNKNYKAFNDIEELVFGDIIKVQSENTEFIYEVFSVEEANAEDFRIDFNTNKRLLTISTCNTFGDLNDRFVVQAELVGTRNLNDS